MCVSSMREIVSSLCTDKMVEHNYASMLSLVTLLRKWPFSAENYTLLEGSTFVYIFYSP